jgi:hypothetical protein
MPSSSGAEDNHVSLSELTGEPSGTTLEQAVQALPASSSSRPEDNHVSLSELTGEPSGTPLDQAVQALPVSNSSGLEENHVLLSKHTREPSSTPLGQAVHTSPISKSRRPAEIHAPLPESTREATDSPSEGKGSPSTVSATITTNPNCIENYTNCIESIQWGAISIQWQNYTIIQLYNGEKFDLYNYTTIQWTKNLTRFYTIFYTMRRNMRKNLTRCYTIFYTMRRNRCKTIPWGNINIAQNMRIFFYLTVNKIAQHYTMRRNRSQNYTMGEHWGFGNLAFTLVLYLRPTFDSFLLWEMCAGLSLTLNPRPTFHYMDPQTRTSGGLESYEMYIPLGWAEPKSTCGTKNKYVLRAFSWRKRGRCVSLSLKFDLLEQ